MVHQPARRRRRVPAGGRKRIRCGVIVTGVTYRHPAVLANTAVTIDHISGGRLELGMVAAWYELEHEQYGIAFPPMGVRAASNGSWRSRPSGARRS